ncbi:MAG: hypothetical protein LC751_03605 [Actinobacteria bacterium]|nr:hypothetical protein [Actinomycetota bacterium]
MPIVPIVGIVFSLVLIASLPDGTWARFAIWMLIGLGVYFLYSRSHSWPARGAPAYSFSRMSAEFEESRAPLRRSREYFSGAQVKPWAMRARPTLMKPAMLAPLR